MRLLSLVWLVCLFLIGCATSQQAPVIDRAPGAKKPEITKPASIAVTPEKDWRPEAYTVKKGDTLYSIGLEYGYDYREIAQTNNIQPPYVIHIGQQLNLRETKPAVASTSSKPAAESDVVITPLNSESAVSAPQPTGNIPGNIPLLSEPKALREPYSERALAAAFPKPAAEPPGKVVKPVEIATVEPSKAESTPDYDEGIEWAWPASGKIVAGFNDTSNGKGIDISGAQGQAVTAAAPGKVIYSGSDLRGYGKLVIIKHNKTYLSVYAHNSQILVKEGQMVNKGQKIAEMGSSDTDRVKLHFEIRRQGKSVDPTKYLSGSPG